MENEANAVIRSFGGTGKTAELCEISPGAVSQWRKDGIPKPWKKYLMAIKPEAFVGAADTEPEPRQEAA